MRPLRDLMCSVIALSSVLLIPAISMAGAHSSWCVTGDPMSSSDTNLDGDTQKVVAGVCGQTAFASCCATGGRWGLSCVQAGAVWAKANTSQLGTAYSNGDYCGRFQWAQGPLPNTQQYYPRDFNFVALTGTVPDIPDTDDPVAAGGNVNMGGSTLNKIAREPVALVTAGTAALTRGTVYGNLYYGAGTFSPDP